MGVALRMKYWIPEAMHAMGHTTMKSMFIISSPV
jgi:hypothetical protein